MIEEKLKKLGVEIPEAKAPVANYVGYTRTANIVFVSGQISQIKGKLGADVTEEQGYEAAKQSAISVLAQLKAACHGNLDKVEKCLKLEVFVNSTADFTAQPKVANGASDLIAEAIGKHARAAVSSNSLPMGVAVEVAGIFEVA
jgi:enamine deaminase RidA (YjgF/YER057c/UK114 family)